MTDPILTLEEAAALLKVSPEWLRRSTCPRCRVGGVVRWDRDAREAVGLSGYQLRDARHSYAVRAILAGVPLWQVSKYLGHANLGITAKVYTQFQLEDALAALDATARATPRRTAK